MVEALKSQSKEPVLQARGLCKTYRMGELTVTALHDVDLDLYEGELAVMLGASGSGKSTLLNIIGGLDDEVRTATVSSVTPCTLYVLERKDVEEVMEKQPSIRVALQRADQRRRMQQAEMENK